MSIGKRIRAKRIALGWDQKTFAFRLGISQGAVAQIETGRRFPSLILLIKLTEVMEVDSDFLLLGRIRERMDVSDLDAGDRLLVQRFCDFLRWAKHGETPKYEM